MCTPIANSFLKRWVYVQTHQINVQTQKTSQTVVHMYREYLDVLTFGGAGFNASRATCPKSAQHKTCSCQLCFETSLIEFPNVALSIESGSDTVLLSAPPCLFRICPGLLGAHPCRGDLLIAHHLDPLQIEFEQLPFSNRALEPFLPLSKLFHHKHTR